MATDRKEQELSQVPPKEPSISSTENPPPEDLINNESLIQARAVERRFVWKLDLIVLPLLSIIYFTHSLDRANLGNAKTDGIEDDLNMKANQYSLMLVLFYIPYGTLNIPATVLARRFSPAVVIPLLMFFWGVISLAAASVHNFGGILAARICLGIVEAGFVANAFSGLIAWSVFQWHRKLHNWQYLFIIEGSLTVALAITAIFALPRDVASSRYFTDAEKRCATLRKENEEEVESSKFSWSATLNPLGDWRVWMYGFMALGYGVGSSSVSNFLPTFIKRLTTDTVTANLYTIAPNLSGGIFIVLTCWLSDKLQRRAFFAIGAVCFPIVGFIVLGTADLVHNTAAGYFCTFLLTFGSFTPAVLIPAWLSSNMVSPSGRATALGLATGLQNVAGIVSSEAFRTQDAPVYAPSLIVSGCFEGAMVVAVAIMYFYYRRINRQLDQGKLASVKGMENSPDFRYVL